MTVNVDKLKAFLLSVDKSFPTPLSEKQDISALAEKFAEKATLCCVEKNGKILAMVAGYTENVTENRGYISVVAALPEARGRGFASRMVKEFIEIAASKGLSSVHLYTVRENIPAVKMYEKLGFLEWSCENEQRPKDLHLILEIRKETKE